MNAHNRILVVEDEPLIAMMLEDYLDILGRKVAGVADSVSTALPLVAAGGIDAAIVDVNLNGGEKCWPVADALAAAGVPFVVATGGGGGLSFKTVRAALLPLRDALMEVAARAQMDELASIASRTTPFAEGSIALVGATLVDATGAPAVPNATVVVLFIIHRSEHAAKGRRHRSRRAGLTAGKRTSPLPSNPLRLNRILKPREAYQPREC